MEDNVFFTSGGEVAERGEGRKSEDRGGQTEGRLVAVAAAAAAAAAARGNLKCDA